MGRMFSALVDGVSVSLAKDLLKLTAPSTGVVTVHEVVVTQEASEVSEQLAFQLQRSSASGAGPAVTPERLNLGDATFAGTILGNLTADTLISGAPLYRKSENILNGWFYLPTPEARIVVPAAGIFVVRLDEAPAAPLTLTLCMIFESNG
jgi:hypothetical protein